MKKILMLCVIAILFSSCRTQYAGGRWGGCPTNDKSFFYKRAGVTPSKQFLKWGN